MKQPFVSVVVPTFNRAESLAKTLDGLSRQTYPCDRFEVVVVSDGSTDGTSALVTERATEAPFRMRLLSQQNAGPSRARNQGVQHAHGEVILFMDDDVEPQPEALAAHALHHEQDDKIAVIGPMSPDPKRRRKEPAWIAWEHAMLAKQYANWRSGLWTSAGPNHFYSGNASVRRRHILASGGFDEGFKRQEDVELAYRMQSTSDLKFVFDGGAVGIHRPVRSFSAWLAVPYSYGQLDVARAQSGNASWDIVRHGYHARSRPTRILASIALTCPILATPLRMMLLAGVNSSYHLGLRRLSMGALSMIYNVRYLEGVQAAIGTQRDTRCILKNRQAYSEAS